MVNFAKKNKSYNSFKNKKLKRLFLKKFKSFNFALFIIIETYKI